MPTNTGNLGLTEPSGSDVVSELRLAIAANAVALGNADIYATGTISARPAAATGNTGMFYYATDTGLCSLSTGSAWLTLAPDLTSGTLGSRPSAGSVPNGSTYLATDAGTLSVGNGSAWSVFAPLMTPYAPAGNATAIANATYYMAPSSTLTLPSSPAQGAMVGVQAAINVSGASPVTVSASYWWIYGIGMGTMSFLLGTPSASVLLQYNGLTSTWEIISGQQDSGWVPLTLGSGVTASSGAYQPSARIVGDRVYLSGLMHNNSGGTLSNATWASLPSSAFEPASDSYLGGWVTPALLQAGLYVVPGSTAIVVQAAVTNNQDVALDSLFYRLV